MKIDRTKMIEALSRVVQRMHYPLEVMLVCVRWYAAYPLSFRNVARLRNLWVVSGSVDFGLRQT